MLEYPDSETSTQELYRTLLRMQQHQEWGFFIGWLKSNRRRIEANANKERDNIDYRWNQGALQLLEDLFRLSKEAKEASPGILYQLPSERDQTGVM